MPTVEPGLHSGGNKELPKCSEQEVPLSKMWLEGCPWQECGGERGRGKQVGISGVSVTRAWEQDLKRCKGVDAG